MNLLNKPTKRQGHPGNGKKHGKVFLTIKKSFGRKLKLKNQKEKVEHKKHNFIWEKNTK